MECPYCAESIKDNATVCRYCQRDLSNIKPVVDKVSSLEQRTIRVESSLNSLQSRIADVSSEHSDILLSLRIQYTILMPLLISIGAYWLYMKYELPSVIMWISLLCAFPFGIWLGATWKEVHLRSYAIYGFVIGLIGQSAMYCLHHTYFLSGDPIFPLEEGWYLNIGSGVIMVMLLFIGGGLLGDWIESKRPGARQRDGLTEKLAVKLVDVRRKYSTIGNTVSAETEKKVVTDITKILKVAVALTPSIIALIGKVKQYAP